jgi:hypothetical protein
MPSKEQVTWYVEPLNELTNRSIWDLIENSLDSDPELRSIVVDGATRSAFRLDGYHQIQLLKRSLRDGSRYNFRILRKRSDQRNDITEVVESWGHASRATRVAKPKPDQLLASGAVHRGMPRKG